MSAREGRGVYDKLRLIFPIRQPSPLQGLFVVAIERVGDQLIPQKIHLHDARDFRVVPLLNPGMGAVIQRMKPPAAMKNHRARWKGESWKAGENKNKDCGQNSRTFGALINGALIDEASINEAQINDHRTARASQ